MVAFAAALLAMVASASCNLELDTEDYPYRVPLVIDEDTGTPLPNNTTPDMSTPDVGNNTTPDMGPVGTPRLVITEILINTSFMDSSIGFGELGEFIEIKNVGDAPADPQAITMRLTEVEDGSTGNIFISAAVSQEQLEVLRALKRIDPGEYFVFVRHAVPEIPIAQLIEPGRSYDYGRYGEGVSLTNSQERVLELRYNNGETIITSDRVRWRNDDFIAANGDAGDAFSYPEDVSITVAPGNEAPDMNDTPVMWCLSGDTTGDVQASPGSAGTCQ
jgi:hypothetical protein